MTDDDVIELRRLCAARVPQKVLAERFGISPQAVSKYKRGLLRPDLPGAQIEDGRGKLTTEQRDEIRVLLEAEVPQGEIAERYNITQSAVALIKLRDKKRARKVTSRGR